MTQSLKADDILQLNGNEVIEMLDNLQSMHDQLVDQNAKLQEIFQQNQRKILCYEASIEVINQLIDKSLSKSITDNTNKSDVDVKKV